MEEPLLEANAGTTYGNSFETRLRNNRIDSSILLRVRFTILSIEVLGEFDFTNRVYSF